MTHNLAEILRLVLVTDDAFVRGRDLVSLCLAAERGGVTAVQLRLKEASPRELASTARALLVALRVPLFLNDRLDVALAVGAAGVHLGPDDMPIAMARRIVPARIPARCVGRLGGRGGAGGRRGLLGRRSAPGHEHQVRRRGAIGIDGFASDLFSWRRQGCRAWRSGACCPRM